MGSGTMGVAAVREGFRFLGSDMTPWAHAVARARIRWAQGLGVALEDAPPPVAGSAVQGSLFG
jgi:DNA modification methylase